jgi:hypothetical protein
LVFDFVAATVARAVRARFSVGGFEFDLFSDSDWCFDFDLVLTLFF